jgi:hypothetical protein
MITQRKGELGTVPGGPVAGATGKVPQFFDGIETVSAIAVTPPGSDVTGIDAELAKGARIEGIVSSGGDGSALPGIPVCLFGVAAVKPSQCDARLSAVAGMPQVSSSAAPAAAVHFVGEPVKQPKKKKSCPGSTEKKPKERAGCVKNHRRNMRKHRTSNR